MPASLLERPSTVCPACASTSSSGPLPASRVPLGLPGHLASPWGALSLSLGCGWSLVLSDLVSCKSSSQENLPEMVNQKIEQTTYADSEMALNETHPVKILAKTPTRRADTTNLLREYIQPHRGNILGMRTATPDLSPLPQERGHRSRQATPAEPAAQKPATTLILFLLTPSGSFLLLPPHPPFYRIMRKYDGRGTGKLKEVQEEKLIVMYVPHLDPCSKIV